MPFIIKNQMDKINTFSLRGIHYLLNKLVNKSQTAYDLIEQKVQSTRLPNVADETEVKVCGEKHWAWTWQNEKATFVNVLKIS